MILHSSHLVFHHLLFNSRSKIEQKPDNKEETSLGKAIMEDSDTADFTLRCETKSFRVHKAVFCAR